MKLIFQVLFSLIALISCGERSDVIEATVIEQNRNLFSEWRTDGQSQRVEDRFLGVRVQLSGKGIRDTAWLIQSWPGSAESELPKIGTKFFLSDLPHHSSVIPIEGKSYWFRELKQIEPNH